MHGFPVAYLNSNNGTSILAFGEGPKLRCEQKGALTDIQSFVNQHAGSFIFGAMSYELKNCIEDLQSNNTDEHLFPLALFWVPEYVVRVKGDAITFVQGASNEESQSFLREFIKKKEADKHANIPGKLKARTSKDDYLRHVEQLKNEIQLGNIYEVNYCQEFYLDGVQMEDAISTYFRLNNITRAPYSSLFCIDEFSVLSGSPERYIRRQGNQLISSPIKGTSKRGGTEEEDKKLKKELLNDQKERSENVMIVDLVRNDLSKIATNGSVKVDELFGIYTFETVHQMISTVTCELEPETTFTDIIRATFPMGSMTGAPKVSAMQLIEEHEDFQRGIYSGSIGFIDPNGDFDFNVIIRTLIHNSKNNYLSCPVGGAITIKSSPEREYEECKVKVQGILERMYAQT